MKVFSFTAKGLRKTNEDYIKSEILSDSISLHIVADGMGGYKYGEVASQTATEAIFKFLTDSTIQGDIPALIQQAVEFANSQIFTLRNQYHTKLGTTLAGVIIIDCTAYAFWLGDVQIQHFRDSKQLFISESHSLINEMKSNGVISGKDIERYKNIVTRSLSGTPLEESIPIVVIQLEQGDIICISSDGFYNTITPSKLITNSEDKLNSILQDLDSNNGDNFSITIITFN